MRNFLLIIMSLLLLASCSSKPEDCIGGDVVAVTTSPEGNHMHIMKDGSEVVHLRDGETLQLPTPTPEPTPEPTPTPTPMPTLSPAEIAAIEAEYKREAVAYVQEQGFYTYEDLALAYYDLEQMYNELEYENDELWDENEELHDDISYYKYD